MINSKKNKCAFTVIFAAVILAIMICVIAYFVLLFFKSEVVPLPTHDIPECINIPDSKQVNNFCKEQGFEYGWMDSVSCGKNQVNCYRKVGQYSELKCIDWVIG